MQPLPRLPGARGSARPRVLLVDDHRGMLDRVSALLSPVLFLVDDGELLLALALAFFFAIAWRRGVLIFDRRMLMPVSAIGFASLLMPAFLSGIYLVHIRLPLLAVLLVIASCRLRALPPHQDRRRCHHHCVPHRCHHPPHRRPCLPSASGSAPGPCLG